MDEYLTRGVPIGPDEIAWAHERPAQHRVPVPKVGDQVMYRHNDWEPPTAAEVLDVQPLDDLDDPHLWRVQIDPYGQPVEVEGRRILAQRLDPWPKLTLRTIYGVGVTREARVRGSAGWLPLDWHTRHRPAPVGPDVLLVRNGG